MRRLHGLNLRSLVQQMIGFYFPASLDRSLRHLTGVPDFPGWLKHAAWDHLGVGALKPWRPAARKPGDDFVRQMSMAQLFQNSLPMLLHWADRNSMRHGIEARLPFLDYRLVEYAVSLPSAWKFEQGVSKNPLRVAMRGVVPEPVLQRTDKMGFVTPEEVWLRKDATDPFRGAVQETLRRFPEFLDAPEVMKRFEATVDGRLPFSSLFWRILCFGAWARVFRMEM
jgi:asparagine synthase (glutamine-hydrolysing)